MMMYIEGEDKALKNIQKARELLDQAEKLLWETKGAFKMKIEPSPDCTEDDYEKVTITDLPGGVKPGERRKS